VRARLTARVQPGLRRRGRDHARAQGDADGDGGQADAAAGAKHQQRLVSAQRGQVYQPVPAGAVVELKAGRHVRVHPTRRLEAVVGADQGKLCEAARRARPEDMLAHREAGDALANRNDLAADLLARSEGWVSTHHVLAFHDKHIREGQPSAEHPHQRSAFCEL
jgi:hypothetical protein